MFSYRSLQVSFPRVPGCLCLKPALSALSLQTDTKQLEVCSAFVFLSLLSSLVELTGSFPLGVAGEGVSLTARASKLLRSGARTKVLLDVCDEI